MVLNEFYPTSGLQDYIRVYRIVDFDFKDFDVLPFKPYPPKPEHCLSFYPRDTERVEYINSKSNFQHLRGVLMGQQCEVTHRYVGRNFLVFQVVFRAGALYRITGIPSNLLTNQYLDATSIFSNQIPEINEKLSECHDYSTMVGVVENFLQKQISKSNRAFHPIDLACEQLISNFSTIPKIDQLAQASFLSVRQFERKFIERMGISPKYYCKVARFEKAFRLKNIHPNMSWTSVAESCGYYDYQHLVKDYVNLTMQTPNAFHLLDLSSPERIFGEADTY